MKKYTVALSAIIILSACGTDSYDIVLRNGTVIDGSGSPAFVADVAVNDGKIAAIGKDLGGHAADEIDISGNVIAPGFIDMLSWACGPVLYDGEVHSVVRQGITTAIFGEGWSMGPVNDAVRKEMQGFWPEYKIAYDWKTLTDYLRYVENKGTSVNVASFVGATTVRLYVIGTEDRRATAEELEEMKELVRTEMSAGALGLASSLVYTPAFYADTHELVELAKVAAEFNGIYISHIRGEGSDLLKALNELITISESAEIPAEIYHFKAAGKANWDKLDDAIRIVEASRANGLDISADIYPYTAGATQLAAMLPPWAKEGGADAMVNRLKDKKLREKIKNEIENSYSGWENFYWLAGGGENILVSYLSPGQQQLQGKTIAEIARLQNKDELETVFDLLISEHGGGGGIYFLMSEENVKKKMSLPWVSFCTDEDAYKTEGLMSKRNPHPRAYGTFPRILGKYVREEQTLSLEEAIRKMTSQAASWVGLSDRGYIRENFAADMVVFDPNTVIDKATYTQPHQYPEGIIHVIVNGQFVVKDSEHTGQKPGQALFKKH
jgi:N-acyl-D-amino-acid deacylase